MQLERIAIFPKYLSAEDVKQVRSFEFKGEDRSLFYNYFLSPLCEEIIRFIPTWVHPNVLTVCGLFCNIVSHLTVLWYCPSLTESSPGWVWALTGVMVLAYQLFDNLDGKQARRLGLSSALGLVVDHGCDGINIVMSTFSAAALFQFGAGLRTLTVLFMASTQFFFAAWDEYYRGEFILPYINGPNEGVLILASIYLMSSQLDDHTTFWHVQETLPFIGGRFERRDVALALCSISAIPVILTHVYGVFRHITTTQRKQKHSNLIANKLLNAISTAAPYCIGVILACLWMMTSNVMSDHPRLVIWFIGLLFSQIVTIIQVAHVCDAPLAPYRWTCILPVIIISFNRAIGIVSPDKRPPIDESPLLVCLFIFALMSWTSTTVSVLRDISEALSVPVWSVPVKVQAECRASNKVAIE